MTQQNKPQPSPATQSTDKQQPSTSNKFTLNGVTGGAGHGRCDKYINPLTSK